MNNKLQIQNNVLTGIQCFKPIFCPIWGCTKRVIRTVKMALFITGPHHEVPITQPALCQLQLHLQRLHLVTPAPQLLEQPVLHQPGHLEHRRLQDGLHDIRQLGLEPGDQGVHV